MTPSYSFFSAASSESLGAAGRLQSVKERANKMRRGIELERVPKVIGQYYVTYNIIINMKFNINFY